MPMILQDLFEDAQDDVLHSSLAAKFIDNLVSFLYAHKNEDYHFNEVVFHSMSVPCITAPEFGENTLFKNVAVIFFTGGINSLGQAMTLQRGTWPGFKYAVAIKVDGLSINEIVNSLMSRETRNTLMHELQHVIDYRRWKGDDLHSGKNSVNTQRPEGGWQDSNHDHMVIYNNTDKELNAYFHNLAEPLLFRLRQIKKTGYDPFAFDPIPGEFRDFLKDQLSKLSGTTRRYWIYLTPENRRKVISRLSKLFFLYKDQMTAKAPTVTGQAEPLKPLVRPP